MEQDTNTGSWHGWRRIGAMLILSALLSVCVGIEGRSAPPAPLPGSAKSGLDLLLALRQRLAATPVGPAMAALETRHPP